MFFIVLDLRLTKVGVQRNSFFYAHGVNETPLVTTAPSWFKSTNSLYSCPEPNVPDAGIIGFLKVIPAILIDVLIGITAFLVSNYTKYIKIEKYCLFSFIVLKIILGIKNNSTL